MDLPSIFWKDDKYAIQFLDDINRINDLYEFTLYSDYKFKILLLNGNEVPIIENDRNIDLILEKKKNYIELVE